MMQHLIFDFDGTIVNSGPLVYRNLCQYTDRTDLSWSELRCLPSNEVVSALGISKLDLPKLIVQIRSAFMRELKEQPIAQGVADAITELKEKGFELHIVSSNSKENIEAYLEMHGLREAFSTITSFFTIFGKAHGISKLLSEIKAKPSEAIYIGDETRDVQAAEKVGMKSMAVCWGYNSEIPLAGYKPDLIAKTPQELVSHLCKEQE